MRDNSNRNYEFVVRTIATVGNYGERLPDNIFSTLSITCCLTSTACIKLRLHAALDLLDPTHTACTRVHYINVI